MITVETVSAAVAVVISVYVAATSARKSELSNLRSIIKALREENERLLSRVTELENENSRLLKALGMSATREVITESRRKGLAIRDDI